MIPINGAIVRHWKMNDNVASTTIVDATGGNDGKYKEDGIGEVVK